MKCFTGIGFDYRGMTWGLVTARHSAGPLCLKSLGPGPSSVGSGTFFD